MQEFRKSVKIWQSYCRGFGAPFFETQCIYCIVSNCSQVSIVRHIVTLLWECSSRPDWPTKNGSCQCVYVYVNIYSEATSPQLVCAAVLVSTSWDKNSMHLLKSEKDDGVLSLMASETVGSKWSAAGLTASFLIGRTSVCLRCTFHAVSDGQIMISVPSHSC